MLDASLAARLRIIARAASGEDSLISKSSLHSERGRGGSRSVFYFCQSGCLDRSFRRIHEGFELLRIFMLDRSLAFRFKNHRRAASGEGSPQK
jgi:hypothetical protein